MEKSLVFLIFGAFIGAILTPLSDYFLTKWLKDKSGRKFSLQQGLFLLTAANALWVFSGFLGVVIRDNTMDRVGMLGVYLIAALLFVSAFNQFRKAQNLELKFQKTFYFLIMANLTWLLSDLIYHVPGLSLVGYQNLSKARGVFFLVSMVFFLLGAKDSWKYIKEEKS